jgi:enoyl-CoA hydratase
MNSGLPLSAIGAGNMLPLPDLLHASVAIDDAGVTTLCIANAGPLNLLGSAVINDLTAALEALHGRTDVRVVILRGAGDRAFVAGADIQEMAALNRASGEAFITGLRRLCHAVHHFPVPVIARIPGWALGGGMELAMACDMRIAADDAQFGMPEVKVGIPSVIHAALLPRLVGAGNAAWMLLAGELIDAQRAASWGLINEAVPRDQLDERVTHLANNLARIGPAVLRQQKGLLRQWETLDLADSIDASVKAFGAAFDTGEPQCFMNAFLEEKRQRKAR